MGLRFVHEHGVAAGPFHVYELIAGKEFFVGPVRFPGFPVRSHTSESPETGRVVYIIYTCIFI